jgi:Putative neutral zinc metallopeptidase
MRTAVVGALVAMVAAVGCGGSSDDDGGAAGSEPEHLTEDTVSAATATAETIVVDETVGGVDTVPPDGTSTETTEFCPLTGGDLEGCFDYDTMQQFYDEGLNTVIVFIEASFTDPAPMLPAEWVYVAEGETGEEPCTEGEAGFAMYTDMSYEYCPLDQTVYVGQRQLWEFYDRAGDAGAVIGMAHEAGHHMQTVAGVTTRTLEESIVFENQADCVAGAFTAWLDGEELLDYPDDLEDIDVLMTMIASVEDDPMRDHGTLEERIDAFVVGFDDGLTGCNDFFPDTPLVTPT